jgi:hypothetical protein
VGGESEQALPEHESWEVGPVVAAVARQEAVGLEQRVGADNEVGQDMLANLHAAATLDAAPGLLGTALRALQRCRAAPCVCAPGDTGCVERVSSRRLQT